MNRVSRLSASPNTRRSLSALSSTSTATAASLSDRISASLARAASYPNRSAAPKGSASPPRRASSFPARASSRNANSAAVSLCSLRITAAYDASHTADSSTEGRDDDWPFASLSSLCVRRAVGASAAAAPRSRLASAASSPLVIVRSGAHRRRNNLGSSGADPSFGPGSEHGSTGPLGAYTTSASSSCTLARRYARRSLSAVTAAFINISRCPTSLRTSLGAVSLSCLLTTTPSKDLSRGSLAMTCAR